MDQDARAGSRVTVSRWRPPEEQREDVGLLEELREAGRTGDWIAIAAVPVLLVAIDAVGGVPDRSLVLSYAAPTPTSLVTAHYVHRSFTHLLDNLAAYVLVVPTAYAMAVISGRRREFLAAFVAYLVALPPVLSVLDLLVYDRGVTLGFSGVTMAFVGLVALQTGTYLEGEFVDGSEGDPVPGLFFAGLAIVAVRSVSPVELGFVAAGGAAALAGFYLRGSVASVRPIRQSIGGLRSGAGQLGALGLFVLVLGLFVGFPDAPGSGPVVVNQYGHFTGFVLGFLAPYLVFRVLGSQSRETDSRPEAV